MAENKIFHFSELDKTDLHVDALYKGGITGTFGDDPISKLMGTGNQGGFRYVGSVNEGIKLCVLYSSLVEHDWPDILDYESGQFIYYGDNRNPGHELHDTKRKGNEILKRSFQNLHTNNRLEIAPFFVFTKAPEGRDVYFRGLAVPGGEGMNTQEDLVAIWKTKEEQRFQNYKAAFTILDEPVISRNWINDLCLGKSSSEYAPLSWLNWLKSGIYNPLIAPRSITHRNKLEQLPQNKNQQKIVETIIKYFKDHPKREYAFEKCAAEIAVMMDSKINQYDLTRPWRDGGRDAIGKYKIGYGDSSINVDFALEAKCKNLNSGSGVKETSRLISRLRHRQFGIFVTTSYVSEQAYKEIVEDDHPLVILSGTDIAKILIEAGFNSPKVVRTWLREKFSYHHHE